MVAVTVKDHSATVVAQYLNHLVHIDEPFAMLDGFRVWWMVDQYDPEMTQGGFQLFSQLPALPGAYLSRGEEWGGGGG